MSKLVMLVGTKLQHVVSVLALEINEPRGPSTATLIKPRDDLFWFGKPEILLHLIQFISFQVTIFDWMFFFPVILFIILFHIVVLLIIIIIAQNSFEMATFIWSLVRRDPLIILLCLNNLKPLLLLGFQELITADFVPF